MQDDKPTKLILPALNLSTDPEVLIFNINDIKRLRNEHNILGVLTGTLQQYQQQNLFLSVPLKLNPWEVVWLLETKQAILVDSIAYRRSRLGDVIQNTNYEGGLITTPNCDDVKTDLEIASKYEVPVMEYIRKYLSNSSITKDKFSTYYKYYRYLQNQGYFINPGLKFGGDLVIYPGDPL
ncbi:hypothetical protein G210_1678, partial [Candida maltosa Xu316]